MKKRLILICITLTFSVLLFIVIPVLFEQIKKVEVSPYALENHEEKAVLPGDFDEILGNQVISEQTFILGVLGNFEPPPLRKQRIGPGENGVAVHLAPNETGEANKLIAEYGFNMIASQKISMNRMIMDTRPDECKYWHYPKDLPKASVVIVFHNEGWSTLLRTVHSVINTSPPELLEEIVLVDDFSNTEDLKRLPDYIHKNRFEEIVKYYRTDKREGLVQARTFGAERSKGEVIVILDAHCECVSNWLPPLLARIKANKKTLAVPIVDGLDWNTLAHTPYYGSVDAVGIFEWGLLYKEMTISIDYKKYKSQPHKSPTHAGGLLAIDREWFKELGYYDDGIKIWGGEQYELSFKVWQCGGIVEWVPCSHVAHVYRGPRTKSIHPQGADPNQPYINYIRLAEVWMDEYKEYLYTRKPYIKNLNYGDISKQLELKKNLQCKPFKWFMDEVSNMLLKRFPIISKNKVWGQCKNVKHQVCLDSHDVNYGQTIGVGHCWGQVGSQFFRLNMEGELSYEEQCFISLGNSVQKKFCLDNNGIWAPTGEWSYDQVKKQISSNKEKKCLQTDGKTLSLVECDDTLAEQKWDWREIYL